jgi:integrase
VKETAKQAGNEAAEQGANAEDGRKKAAEPFLGLRFHDLRHQAITELGETGASDATLMALAGHLSREMMEHYSHDRMAAKRSALAKLESGIMKRSDEPKEEVPEPVD